MAKLIGVKLRCGELYCVESPGVFCQMFTQRIDGSNPTCHLFETPLADRFGGIEDWIMRCPPCLEAQALLEKEKDND